MVYFILNTVNLIQSNGYWFCYCNKENEKNVNYVQFQQFFMISKMILIKICLTLIFLNFTIPSSATSLENYLVKIKAPSSAFFIKNMNSEGETQHLRKPGVSLKYSEKLKIAKLKAEKLPIPVEF